MYLSLKEAILEDKSNIYKNIRSGFFKNPLLNLTFLGIGSIIIVKNNGEVLI